MASGTQNMTTYNARIVTGSNSAASPAGALLLSGAGRADDATGDTWLFLDSRGGTNTPWGIKHDQANNKIHIYGNNIDSFWSRMNTGNTCIGGKLGINYDPETSGNSYQLYVNGTSNLNGTTSINGTLTTAGAITAAHSSAHLYLKNTQWTKGTTPSSQSWSAVEYLSNDSSNNRVALLETTLDTSGNSQFNIFLVPNVANSTSWSGIILQKTNANVLTVSIAGSTSVTGSVSASTNITAGTYVYAGTYLQAKTHVYSDTGHFYMKYNNTWYSVLHNHGNGNISVESASGGLYIGYSNTTLVNWMNGRMQLKDGCLSIFPNSSNYREGIRIHSVSNWSDITLCGNDNTGDSGISANSWFIGNNNGNFYIARNGSPGSTAYIGCVSNVWKFVTSTDIPEGAANLSAAATAHTLSIYRNGITIPYQMDNANDGGMLRVRGSSESNTILELGTWDDSGSGETIQFNYYPTTSQVTPTYSIKVPKRTGSIFLAQPWWTSGNGNNVNNLRGGCTFAYTNHNAPVNGMIVAFDCDGSESYTLQLQGQYNGEALYYRNRNGDNGTWNTWRQLVHNAGTWGISITGNAATATALTSNAGGGEQPIYFTGGKPAATSYALKATVNNGTTGRLSYYSGDRAISATTNVHVLNNFLISSSRNGASVDVRANGLIIWGATYGNTANQMISNTAGVFRFSDGGPQIVFNTSNSWNAQAGALIFTDHDAAATGASFHFVTTEGSDNNGGNLTVTAPRFRARKGLTIGQNSDNTSYNFALNGSGNIATGYLYINGGAGGLINGAGTNGGINSIRIGDDVWLGDCNAGGIMGMKSTGANTGFYFYNSGGTQTGQIYTDANRIHFVKSSSDTFQFDFNGAVYISGMLNTGGIRARGGMMALSDASSGNCAVWFVNSTNTESYWKAAVQSDKEAFVFYRYSGTTPNWRFAIRSNGTTSTSSSRKIKHDIQDINFDTGYIIDRMKPVSYIVNGDTTNQITYGFIYEDLVQVLPNVCVSSDGNVGIMYTTIIPVLTKEIQNLRKRLAAVETELNYYRSKI